MMDANITRAANAYKNNLNMMEGLQPAAVMPGEDEKRPSFSNMLGDALSHAVETGNKAEKLQMQALTGNVELADLVTAVAEAELTINTVVAVRDRAVAAYQEIIRMPI